MAKKELSTEELAKQTRMYIREQVQSVADNAHFIAEKAVLQVTRQEIFSLLGIEQRYSGEWRIVDEPGKCALSSVLHEALANKAREVIRAISDTPLNLTETELKKLRAAYKTAYLDQLHEQLYQQAQVLAKERAATDAMALMNQVMEK